MLTLNDFLLVKAEYAIAENTILEYNAIPCAVAINNIITPWLFGPQAKYTD
jgi:hypothetical protein